MKETSKVRLNVALRELNISLDRAVEFLSHKKIEIEARPTTKISKDIYQLLLVILLLLFCTPQFELSDQQYWLKEI